MSAKFPRSSKTPLNFTISIRVYIYRGLPASYMDETGFEDPSIKVKSGSVKVNEVFVLPARAIIAIGIFRLCRSKLK